MTIPAQSRRFHTKATRSLPSQGAIHAFWMGQRPHVFSWIEDFECYACGSEDQKLERAHMIGRFSEGRYDFDGPDEVWNLVLLCRPCHREMDNDLWTFDLRLTYAWIATHESEIEAKIRKAQHWALTYSALEATPAGVRVDAVALVRDQVTV